MDRYQVRAFFIVFLFALTFCGEPDLQDVVIERVSPSTAAQDSREDG